MRVIGITGGLGTGKSAVTGLLRNLGAITFSADEAARAILNPNSPTLQEIARVFGANILNVDGSLNRPVLAAHVFANETGRQTLNSLTHPPILRLLRAQIEACRSDFAPGTIVAVEVPLLFETKMQDWFELIVVVSASQTLQINRVAARNGLSETEARDRIAAQMPLELKTAQADVVVRNEGDWAELLVSVRSLWQQWTDA